MPQHQAEAHLESPSQPESPRHVPGYGCMAGRAWGVCSPWSLELGTGRPRGGSGERKVCVQQGSG